MAPAAQFIDNALGSAESLQLTDDVLANLTALQLTNIADFQFGNASAAKVKRGMVQANGLCKTAPSDSWWPSDDLWELLNILTGDALIKTVPLGAPCYKNSEYYDAAKCAYIIANWESTSMQ